MGYSENICQLCAVSINVARLRTKDEPESAGWGYSGGRYYAGDSRTARCITFAEQSGCENDLRATDWQHFPGRHCSFDAGYNGWKIGADEMKGMNHPRYIVRRPKDAELDDDSAGYEKNSDYFLTSQTIEPPSDFEPGTLEHVRYGITDFFPQNFAVIDHLNDDEMVCGVPVHDACWKIFEHICNMRLGEVDLQGFMALWLRQACGNCGFQNVKHEPVIKQCKQQWWKHLTGTEYLGANPYAIPGLLLGLAECYNDFPKGDNVFYAHNPGKGDSPLIMSNSTDPFRILPAEIKNMLLAHLSSVDITRLRLASRSFRQLPKQLFLQLIKDELPWFWEFDELKQMDDDFWKDLFKDEKPEDKNTDFAKRIQRSREGNVTQHVNWCMVYKQLCVLKKGVLGVRNRARIWYVVEEVVEKIAELRERLTDSSGYNLRGHEDFPLKPTEKELREGMVKNGFYCPRCQVFQIERKTSEELAG